MTSPLAVNGTIHIKKLFQSKFLNALRESGSEVISHRELDLWGNDHSFFLYTDFPLNVIDIAMEILRSILFCAPVKEWKYSLHC